MIRAMLEVSHSVDQRRAQKDAGNSGQEAPESSIPAISHPFSYSTFSSSIYLHVFEFAKMDIKSFHSTCAGDLMYGIPFQRKPSLRS